MVIPSKQRLLSCESLDWNIGVRVSISFCNFTSRNSVKKCLFVAFTEYHCGGLDSWSAVFSFKTFKPGVNWSPRLAMFGDLGSVNAKSLSYLQEETQKGHFDAILHVGEFCLQFFRAIASCSLALSILCWVKGVFPFHCSC